MRKILFIVLISALTACASSRHINRLTPEGNVIYTGGYPMITEENNGLRICLFPDVLPDGKAVFTMDIQNTGETEKVVSHSDFLLKGDYLQIKFYRELDEATEFKTIDPFKDRKKYENLIHIKTENLKKKKDRESTAGIIHATGSLISRIAADSDEEHEALDKKDDTFEKRELRNSIDNIEAGDDIEKLKSKLRELNDTALFVETLAPGESVTGKKICFPLPEYLTNIKLIYMYEDETMVFSFSETRKD